MTSVAAIRDALQAALSTLPDFRVHDVWPEQINVPVGGAVGLVLPERADWGQTLGAGPLTVYQFRIELLAPLAPGLKRAQEALDPYLDVSGARSVKAKLDADRTLGGVVVQTIVRGWRGYGGSTVNEIEYLGATVEVEVWAE